MKKIIILMMTLLLLVAFALPAFSAVAENEFRQTSGYSNNNMQGNQTDDNSINKGANGSNNVAGRLNGAGAVWTAATQNNNTTFLDRDVTVQVNTADTSVTIQNTQTNIVSAFPDVDISGSLNDNEIYLSGPGGDMDNAFQFQYANTHQNDHQLQFLDTFRDSTNAQPFMPLGNVHLSQANADMKVGDYAGAVIGAFNANAVNVSGATISGMMGASTNMGGIAQNQGAANVVTAFSR